MDLMVIFLQIKAQPALFLSQSDNISKIQQLVGELSFPKRRAQPQCFEHSNQPIPQTRYIFHFIPVYRPGDTYMR